MIAECKLCGTKADLQRSHIIPKWAYRRLDGDSITIHNGSATRTSKQVAEHMLCRVCEALFNKDETYVSTLGYQKGKLRISGHLGRRFRVDDSALASFAHVNTMSLARFGASVFWRAQVSEKSNLTALTIGRQHVADLRNFVRKSVILPPSVSLNLVVLSEVGPSGFTLGPTIATPTTSAASDDLEDGFHQFIVGGLLFWLATGQRATHYKPLCLSGPNPTAILMSWESAGFGRDTAGSIGSATPRGSFANR